MARRKRISKNEESFMKINSELQKYILLIIANTKKRKRQDDIVTIATYIEILYKNIGDLNKVARLVSLSTDMLKKFLSVNKLSVDVKKLFKTRKIDSVTIAHLLSYFSNDEQLYLIAEILKGNMNTDDMKVIVPLKNSVSDLKINELVERVISSKDKKIYLILFPLFENNNYVEIFKKNIKNLLKKEDILKLEVKEKVIELGLSKNGIQKIRELAKKEKLTLRNYLKRYFKFN